MHEGKEFFQPMDKLERPMVPIYTALLKLLGSSDMSSIRKFYLEHGTTGLAARRWIEQQHVLAGSSLAPEPLSKEETASLSARRIINTATPVGFSHFEERDAAGAGDVDDSSSRSSCSSSDDENEKSASAGASAGSTKRGGVPVSSSSSRKSNSFASSGSGSGDVSDNDDEENEFDDASDDLNTSRLSKASNGSSSAGTGAHKLLAEEGAEISVYLVYSARSSIVKVGFTKGTYEACRQKYLKLYGHLDEFFFLKVENCKYFSGYVCVSVFTIFILYLVC
jgi:hypothetical protein